MIRYLIYFFLLVVAWESLASASVGYSIRYPLNSNCTGAVVGQQTYSGCVSMIPATIYGTSPAITVSSYFINCSLSGLINYYNDSDRSCGNQSLIYQFNSACIVNDVYNNDDYLIVCGPASTTPTASPILPKQICCEDFEVHFLSFE